MVKHFVSTLIIATASVWMLTACDSSTEATDQAADTDITSAGVTAAPNAIDWSRIASGETAADPTNYQYPFAIDSQNVQDYAEYFKVDAATAQHNLTVSMASNEALSKVLDQLSEAYVSHKISNGENLTLVIHTTSDIAASRYDYVLSGDFGKGLVLPIEIRPNEIRPNEPR